jgi:hypothetical protein
MLGLRIFWLIKINFKVWINEFCAIQMLIELLKVKAL